MIVLHFCIYVSNELKSALAREFGHCCNDLFLYGLVIYKHKYKMSLYMRHKIRRLVYNKHNKVVSDYIQKEAII